MPDKTKDRRFRRSCRLLKQSLLSLMKEKRFADISIREIADRADMNRATFYLHYTDTAQLLRSIEEDLLAEAQGLIDAHIQETEEARSVRPVFQPILTFVVEKREVCSVLLENNEASGFVQGLQQLIWRNGEPLVRAWFHAAGGQQVDYTLRFLTWGLLGLVKEWFDQDMAMSQEDLLDLAGRLVHGASEAALPAPAAGDGPGGTAP